MILYLFLCALLAVGGVIERYRPEWLDRAAGLFCRSAKKLQNNA